MDLLSAVGPLTMLVSRRGALAGLTASACMPFPVLAKADNKSLFDLPDDPIKRTDGSHFAFTRDKTPVIMASPGQPYSYAEGRHAQRFEVRLGDICKSIDHFHPGQKVLPERCLVVWEKHRPFFTPTRFGFDFMVSLPGTNTNPWTLLAQYHNHADMISPGVFEPWCSPPLAVMLTPDRKKGWQTMLTISGRFITDRITTRCPDEMILGSVPFTFDTPHRLDVTFVNGRGGPGSVKAVMDGVTIADYRGPIGFNDEQGCYFSFGAYRSPFHAANQHMVAHYANVVEGLAT